MSSFKPNMWLCVAAAWLIAIPAMAADPPFSGVITQDNTPLRSGAGETYYTVAALKSGDKVEVRNFLYDWYEVDPPAGVFSYIAKEYVKLDADGKTGVVTGERVRVRAPSPDGPEPGASYKVQVKLDRGEAVTVLGEAGDFYKIAPPRGARLYVYKEYVRPATSADRAAAPAPPAPPSPARAAPAPPAAPTPPATPQPKPPVPPVVTVPRPAPAEADQDALVIEIDADGVISIDGQDYDVDEIDTVIEEALADDPDLSISIRSDRRTPYESVSELTERLKAAGVATVKVEPIEPVEAAAPAPADGQAASAPAPPARRAGLDDLEQRFLDASRKPLLDQPVGELRIEYEKMLTSESLSPTDRALVKARIDMLDHRRELQARVGDVRAFRQQLDTSRKERQEAERLKPKQYAAVGRLQASTIYTGEKLPLLYRVYDPSTNLTVAYIQPPDRMEDVYATLVGQYVGVVGDKDYDPTLKLDVVRAKEVDVLRPQ